MRTLRGLKDLKDPKFLMAAGGTMLGGGLLTGAFSQVAGRVPWVNSGAYAGLKRFGVAAAIGLVGGALLRGRFPNVALGMLGAVGAVGYVDNAGRAHAELAFPMLGMPTTSGYALNQWAPGAETAFAASRTYDQPGNQLFGSGFSAVRVSQDDGQVFAGATLAGSYTS